MNTVGVQCLRMVFAFRRSDGLALRDK